MKGLSISTATERGGEREKSKEGKMVLTRGKEVEGGTIAPSTTTSSENSNKDGNGKAKLRKGNEASSSPASVSGSGSGYEQFRDQTIKENKERMQKLGILDLSLQLKSQLCPPKRTPKNVSSDKKKPQNPLPPSAPARRSTRLKSMTPVSYVEISSKRKRESPIDVEIRLREGTQPEIYTEEHEKLLGDSKTAWTLYVDGCGKDGKRIYDPEKGETCHQCRQKTLGLHTHCSKCNLVQGQFCGDCLYMRYGENVIEVNQDPNWICPVCRGICNCSLCRQAKGWAPTGALYRKITKLGFKSVAHYLIQTRRPQMHSKDSGAERIILREKDLSSADDGSQNVACNESQNAVEHLHSKFIEVPVLEEFPSPLPDGYEDEMEEGKRQVLWSDNSKHADINDGNEDECGDDTVDIDNESQVRQKKLLSDINSKI